MEFIRSLNVFTVLWFYLLYDYSLIADIAEELVTDLYVPSGTT